MLNMIFLVIVMVIAGVPLVQKEEDMKKTLAPGRKVISWLFHEPKTRSSKVAYKILLFQMLVTTSS